MGRAARRSGRAPPGWARLLPATVLAGVVSALLAVGTALGAGVPAQPPNAAGPEGKAPARPAPVPASPALPAWTIGDELWDRPRSAEVIRMLPAVRGAVDALLGTPGASLVIRHGRGQNDGLRAEELRHWLVALALEPARVRLVPAAGGAPEGLPRGTLVLELAR